MKNKEKRNNTLVKSASDNDGTFERDSITSTLNMGNIQKGLRYFAILTVLGLTSLFFYSSSAETFTALQKLQGRFILLAIVLSGFDLWIGGFRNHILVKKIKPGVSQALCFRANVANLFMGAVTPSQSGGGPAQLFILYRGGIKLPAGISVSVINFLSTLVFFLVSASIAIFIVRHNFSKGVVQYLIQYGFIAFAALFILFLVALLRPDFMAWGIKKLGALIGKTGHSLGTKIQKIGDGVSERLGEYHATCMQFIKEKPILLLYSFVLTVVMYVNKFILAYFIMRGLGVDGNFTNMLALQTILLFILYFCPSPGGSGFAEISIGTLMTIIMPSHIIPIFTLLQRSFLLYFPAAIGAFIMMKELKPTPVPSEEAQVA